jgi:hypothetical protein
LIFLLGLYEGVGSVGDRHVSHGHISEACVS